MGRGRREVVAIVRCNYSIGKLEDLARLWVTDIYYLASVSAHLLLSRYVLRRAQPYNLA